MKCTVLKKIPEKTLKPLQPRASEYSAGTRPGTFPVFG